MATVRDDKLSEAQLVRAKYDALKGTPDAITQNGIARIFGVTQGLVQAWLSGATRIPDSTLFQLGNILHFDPIAIRPSLRVYLAAAKALTGGRQEDERVQLLLTLYEQLDEDQKAQLESYAKFLNTGD